MKNIIVIFLIVFLASCQDDFLELSPSSEANVENFYRDANDFNTALMGVYNNLRTHVQAYFEMVEYRSDNLGLDAPTAGTQDRYNIDQFVETSANSILKETWSDFYKGISLSNEIISRISRVNFNQMLKDQYEGEARFLRAINYFNLVRFWDGVPLVLNPISPADAITVKKATREEVFAAIEQDLLIAIDKLPVSYDQQDLGRATKGAAQTLLGNVLLEQHDYSNALSYLKAVIESNEYALLEDVSKVFDVDNKMNAEIIFAIRYNKDVIGASHGLWFANSDPSTSSPITDKLLASYQEEDTRKNTINFTEINGVFMLNKFTDDISDITQGAGNDYPIFRYADVLLMYAEALNANNYVNDGEAFQYLNEVRKRAGLNELTGSDLPDQNSFADAILQERQFEFPFEGKRWFDLKRFDEAISEMDEAGFAIQDYQLLFPIPQTEIEKINNLDILAQNPGY